MWLNYQARYLPVRLPESPYRAGVGHAFPELAKGLPPRLDLLERVFTQLGRVGERVAAPIQGDGPPTSIDDGEARAFRTPLLPREGIGPGITATLSAITWQ